MARLVRSAAFVSILVAVCLLAAGCGQRGPELAKVTGLVTLDGKPLSGARITFQPADGSPSSAVADVAGRYELMYTADKPGAMIGKHTVTITTRGHQIDDQGNEVEISERVPARYNLQSELSAVVVAGPNEIDFRLTSDDEAAQSGEGPAASPNAESPSKSPKAEAPAQDDSSEKPPERDQ